jgi:ABC-type amino acid transport substrate-binding protein
LQLNEYLVWTRRMPSWTFDGPADLPGTRAACPESARLTPAFTFRQAQLKLVPAQNLTQAFQKLVLGQVDYVLAGRYSGMAMAQSLGMSNDLSPAACRSTGRACTWRFRTTRPATISWLRGQLAKK